MKKRLLSIMLVLSMCTVMFTGCKASKKVTAEEVMKNMSQNSLELAKAADDAVADSKLTYDEVKNLVSKIPEGTLTIGFDGQASASLTQQGQTMDMSGSVNGNVVVDVDSSDMECAVTASVGYKYDAAGMNGSQNITVKAWIIKEAEGYYVYTQQGVGVAEREFIGNLEDVFKDGIDISEYVEELNGASFAKSIEESNDNYKNVVLNKDTIDYNGKKCYHLTMDVTGDQTLELLKNNEEYRKSMEAQTGMTFEEMLTTKIIGDMTYADIFKACELHATYYVTEDGYSLAYCGIDMKAMMKNLCELMIPAVTGAMFGSSDMTCTVDVSSCNFYYSFDKADVDVTFTSDYKDVK